MLAVLALGDRPYPLAIAEHIEERTGRRTSRAAVLITLERLEGKGLLTSITGETSDSRGGRPKRVFRATPAGVKSVKRALSMVTRMHRGLEPVLGDL